jgi:hypothetical protein
MTKELIYKVRTKDGDVFQHEDWDSIVSIAREMGATKIEEWWWHRCTACLDLPRKPSPDYCDLTSSLNIPLTQAQRAWITRLEDTTGVGESELVRIGLSMIAALVQREAVPRVGPGTDPAQYSRDLALFAHTRVKGIRDESPALIAITKVLKANG